MARVVVAREAGACFGVERALAMVREQARAASGPTHTLGPLIHNPQVVRELADSGVEPVAAPADAKPGSTLFLRTHGVTPEVEDEARDLGLKVIDATCPFVKRVHLAARHLHEQGYQVFVVGEKGHPEVEGTLGHAPGAQVLSSCEDVERVRVERKVGLVVQTTLAASVLRTVVGRLVGACEELRVMNTICEATSRRQDAAAELAREADVMLVLGGRNSANTTHLAQICAADCARCHHIETPDELRASWLHDAELVGITAGASTPASQVDALRARVEALVG